MPFLRPIARLLAPALAGLAVAASGAPSQAGEGKIFFIPASSGYGISECLAPGSHCGRVVADSWCESKGYGPAVAYGRADDITATIPADVKKVRAIETDSFVIKCAD